MDLKSSCPTMQMFGRHFFCFIVLYLGSGREALMAPKAVSKERGHLTDLFPLSALSSWERCKVWAFQ